jgi:predicted nuclease of predicted toxin-antitoxin system
MKILLDENVPHRLRFLLAPMHQAFTVEYMGWKNVENGELLAVAAASGFDVMLTTDRGLQYEQHQETLPLSVVILRAKTNKLEDLAPLVEQQLLSALQLLEPRTLIKIEAAKRS